MQLSQMRALVRTQTETEGDELPDTTIDWYLQQAFERTLALENDWPFLEKTWTLVQPSGESTIDLPGDVNPPGVEVLSDSNGGRLKMVDRATAEAWFGGIGESSNTRPAYFIIWENRIELLPRTVYADDVTYRLSGHRLASKINTTDPSSSPDCDERLHNCMIHYAIALAYAQQEDEQLEDTYMSRWERDAQRARGAIMEPKRNRPIIFGRRATTKVGVPVGARYTIIPPGGS